ncbi:hypothetical protein PMO31116_04185 [Pandoraea morbifera]|uniref:Uncharacterized protein n=1 Tax=Pandoraea morbifera TaxID=2508300 RepID=A0A5E4Y246_9BURK|nr:hypothetical protein PMO31116_04185 [Pandoraea morbifera]
MRHRTKLPPAQDHLPRGRSDDHLDKRTWRAYNRRRSRPAHDTADDDIGRSAAARDGSGPPALARSGRLRSPTFAPHGDTVVHVLSAPAPRLRRARACDVRRPQHARRRRHRAPRQRPLWQNARRVGQTGEIATACQSARREQSGRCASSKTCRTKHARAPDTSDASDAWRSTATQDASHCLAQNVAQVTADHRRSSARARSRLRRASRAYASG